MVFKTFERFKEFNYFYAQFDQSKHKSFTFDYNTVL
jgi:hypothetical protein